MENPSPHFDEGLGGNWTRRHVQLASRLLGLGAGTKKTPPIATAMREIRRAEVALQAFGYLLSDNGIGDITPGETRALRVLVEDGRPRTRQQIADALRLPWRKRMFRVGSTTYLAKPLRRNLIVVAGENRRGKQAVKLYSPASGVGLRPRANSACRGPRVMK